MIKLKGVIFLSISIVLVALCCSGPDLDQQILTAEVPLYLEEHLDDGRIEGSEVPEDLPAPIEWRFDEPQPDWKPVEPLDKKWKAVKTVRVDDALRLNLKAKNPDNGPRLGGEIYVTLPDWNLEDWAHIEITARTSDPVRRIGLDFNYTEDDYYEGSATPFFTEGDSARLITDGTVQTYQLSLAKTEIGRWDGPWTDLGIWFNSQDHVEEAALDILSVKIIPNETIYASAPVGVEKVERGKAHKRSLYTHTPGRVEFRVRIPQAGRLDIGLGTAKKDSTVTFRIVVSRKDRGETTLFEESYADPREWGQRSVDLSSLAGKTVTIELETDSERPGSVAFWAEPTISGKESGYKNRKDEAIKNLCAHFDDEFKKYLSQASMEMGREILKYESLSPDSIHRVITINASHFELGYLIGLIRNQHSGPLAKSRTPENEEINLKIIETYKSVFPQHLEFVSGAAKASGLTIDDIDLRFMEGYFLDFWSALFKWGDFHDTMSFYPVSDQVNCTLLSYYIDDEKRHIAGRNWDQWVDIPLFIVRTKMKDTFEVIGNTNSEGRCGMYNWPADGVNEKGLFLGLAGSNPYSFREEQYPDMPAIDYKYMIQIILETCSTVDEAVKKFRKVRMWFRYNGIHILIADRDGNTAIVEWDVDRKLVVFRNKQHFAALTNVAYQEGEDFMLNSCWRYKKAKEMLKSGISDTGEMLNLMTSVQQHSGHTITTRTCVYDLSKRIMEARFRFENFAVPHVFSFN
jgi:predicted choloylglycine hydrolase